MKHLAALPWRSWAGVVALLVLGASGIYGYQDLAERNIALVQSRAELEQKVLELSDALYAAQQGLQAVQGRLGGFENTVGGLSNTLGVLEKLSKTDRELLQKYSKVFFLNEHYAPAELALIDSEFTYSNTRPEKIHADVWPFLKKLFKDAKGDEVELYTKSAYRSFNEQKALKSAYTTTYGAGTANAFSADQGYSEHQLGTTLDFIAPGQAGALEGFESSKAYAWLLKNAYKYGFILSYPKGNGYYIFEPWHWRFVGKELADYLHDEEKNFYDLEQREIDTYLANIFD